MAAKTLVVLAMAGAMTIADTRRVYPQDTRGHEALLDVSVIVRLDNDAGVPDQILTLAKERATGIYKWIGVNVVWVDAEDAIRQKIRPSYTVVLLTPEGENRKALSEGVTEHVVGQAVPVARRA